VDEAEAKVMWELAFRAGYANALAAAAERVDELDALWRPIPRPSYEEKVAARIAEMARHITGPGWTGTDNGARLPSADWVPDTSRARAEADRWLAIAEQYEPLPCTRCRPRLPVLCCCCKADNGNHIVTYANQRQREVA
jgi:hypothetical protein